MNSDMEQQPSDRDHVVRGKRTKRSRQSNPVITTSCGASSVENSEEDEDMANCLIMLAHSGSFKKPNNNIRVENPEFYLYECKMCNKNFSSFQALGGHRASHKKPKTNQEKRVVVTDDQENAVSRVILLHDSKAKIHECLICGSEFGSGQALGGHMRRHRSNSTTTKIVNIDKKVRNVLELDLNLPPQEDHHRDSKFLFSYSYQLAPTLVDCQY